MVSAPLLQGGGMSEAEIPPASPRCAGNHMDVLANGSDHAANVTFLYKHTPGFRKINPNRKQTNPAADA